LVWEEIGLNWAVSLFGGNFPQLMSNPATQALADAIEQNPLYNTLVGWLLANAEMEWLLIA
jgi:hypothetical protein